VGGEKLPLTVLLEELLDRLRIPSSECAVVVDAGADGKDLIRIKLGAGALADPALVVSIRAGLFEASAKLARQIQAGIMAPLSFERLTPQDLCFSSTGKRILVGDNRAGGSPGNRSL
jgi:hypothetical protein